MFLLLDSGSYSKTSLCNLIGLPKLIGFLSIEPVWVIQVNISFLNHISQIFLAPIAAGWESLWGKKLHVQNLLECTLQLGGKEKNHNQTEEIDLLYIHHRGLIPFQWQGDEDHYSSFHLMHSYNIRHIKRRLWVFCSKVNDSKMQIF